MNRNAQANSERKDYMKEIIEITTRIDVYTYTIEDSKLIFAFMR